MASTLLSTLEVTVLTLGKEVIYPHLGHISFITMLTVYTGIVP
jgi:hypothetical protein